LLIESKAKREANIKNYIDRLNELEISLNTKNSILKETEIHISINEVFEENND